MTGLIATIALYGWAAIQFVQFVFALDFIAGDGVNVWFGTEDAITLILAIAGLSTIVVAPIFFVWIYRAMTIARDLTPALTITPGWAIGWFFVPIASLFKPFEVLTEIVTGSGVSASALAQRTSRLIGWWWGCWIVRGICGLFTIFMPRAEDGMATLTSSFVTVLAISSLIGGCGALVLALIVRRVTSMQNAAVDVEIFA